MADKGGAPDFPTTTVNPTLYGSSTTSAGGTTYNPTDFEKSLVGTSQSGISKALGQLINPTYDSSDFNQWKKDLQTQQQNGFENNVVSPLISRGLLGTSGAANLSNLYGSTMNQQTSDLMDKYRAQNGSILQQLLSTYAIPYDMMSGTAGLSQGLANSVGNYNKDIYSADQALKAAQWQAVGNAVSGVGGAAGGYFNNQAAQANKVSSTKV